MSVMKPETKQILMGYAVERIALRELTAFLSGYDWFEQGAEGSFERAALAYLELIGTEVSEGMRGETELRAAVASILSQLVERPPLSQFYIDTETGYGLAWSQVALSNAETTEVSYSSSLETESPSRISAQAITAASDIPEVVSQESTPVEVSVSR